jgi:hypothetical protein
MGHSLQVNQTWINPPSTKEFDAGDREPHPCAMKLRLSGAPMMSLVRGIVVGGPAGRVEWRGGSGILRLRSGQALKAVP